MTRLTLFNLLCTQHDQLLMYNWIRLSTDITILYNLFIFNHYSVVNTIVFYCLCSLCCLLLYFQFMDYHFSIYSALRPIPLLNHSGRLLFSYVWYDYSAETIAHSFFAKRNTTLFVYLLVVKGPNAL